MRAEFKSSDKVKALANYANVSLAKERINRWIDSVEESLAVIDDVSV